MRKSRYEYAFVRMTSFSAAESKNERQDWVVFVKKGESVRN